AGGATRFGEHLLVWLHPGRARVRGVRLRRGPQAREGWAGHRLVRAFGSGARAALPILRPRRPYGRDPEALHLVTERRVNVLRAGSGLRYLGVLFRFCSGSGITSSATGAWPAAARTAPERQDRARVSSRARRPRTRTVDPGRRAAPTPVPAPEAADTAGYCAPWSRVVSVAAPPTRPRGRCAAGSRSRAGSARCARWAAR